MKLKITLFSFLLSAFFLTEGQAQCNGADFDEVNGIVVIEMESGSLPSGWKRETGKAGFTGSSFIAYRGPNYFNAPNNQVINYKIRINTPGTYRFQFRNTIGVIDPNMPNTEHNDSWIRIPDASNFFARKGSSILYPTGSGKFPNPEGSGGLGYFKVNANSLGWNWDAWTNDGNGHNIFATFNSPGIYTIQIAGRSNGHFIDRMVLFDESRVSYASATNNSRAETRCNGGSPPPPPPPPPPPGNNNPPTVSITSPSNGANVNVGSNVTVNLTSGDSDGSVVKHEIFVNNVKVDTDGSGYSPHTILNIAAGSYAIRALVTDNSGATAESTVNITAGGGGNPPPPPPPPPGGNNPPTVSITSPSNGANVNVGSNVSVNLTSGDSDGSVVKHEIFVNGIKVDTDGSGYTPHTILNIASGSYAIRALVTDNSGATAESIVNITAGGGGTPPPPPPPPGGNNPPTVSIVSPANGQNFSVGSNVVVNLSAGDTDGSVVKYEIFVNGTKVDTDGSNFTPHTIQNISAGGYAIRALVTDNDGATAESTVNITVGGGGTPPPPPPPSGNITLTLVNSSNNTDIQALTNGANLSNGNNINVRANSGFTNTGSVYFVLSGATNRTWLENVAPYALFGDGNGNYANGSFNNGSHRIVATVYSGSSRSGSVLGSITVDFTVNDATGAKVAGAYIYPNPVKGNTFSVKIPGEAPNGEVYFRLIDTSGSEVERGKVNINGEAAEFDLQSFNNRNNGVYYLMLQSNFTSYTIPIIKE